VPFFAFIVVVGVRVQHVLIIHEVDAYPSWKAVFDQAAGIRKNAGEISCQLLRYDNDLNTVVHFSEWSSLDNARRFFEPQKLVKIRRKAGGKIARLYLLARNRTWRTVERISCSCPWQNEAPLSESSVTAWRNNTLERL